MSSKKISDLPDGGALQGADEIPAVRGGANVRVSGSALVGSGDARLTDTRTPKPHAASHLGGADDVLATLDARYASASKVVTVGQNVEVDVATSSLKRFIPTGPVAKLHRTFSPLVCDLAIGLRPNGTDYELLYGWGSSRYWRCLLAQESANPGAFPLRQVQAQAEAVPMVSVLGSDVSVTRGTGVTGPNANATSYGGQYWYGVSSGQTFTFVTPANATRVGVRCPLISNGGLARVSIGGDFTKANLLPTAQDVVNSGAYPGTILVANGGPCAPTDRVLDTYNAGSLVQNPDVQIAIADGLTAGAQTVVLTPVGVARSVGGGTRAYFSGYGYATAATTLATAGVVTYSSRNLMSQASAWEYALQTGGTFFGSVHGYEVEDGISATVDGAPVTLTAGQIATAVDVLEVTRNSHLVNPANTAQTVATCKVVYHLDRDGLRIDRTITWAASLTITGAYIMAAVNGVAWGTAGRMAQADPLFTQGSLLNYPGGPVTLTGVGDNYTPPLGVKAEAAWVYGGNYGLLIWVPNVAQWTNAWAQSVTFTTIEDRGSVSPYVSKIYVPRIFAGQGSEVVAAGTVWQASSLYLMGRFPAGAAASVAA